MFRPVHVRDAKLRIGPTGTAAIALVAVFLGATPVHAQASKRQPGLQPADVPGEVPAEAFGVVVGRVAVLYPGLEAVHWAPAPASDKPASPTPVSPELALPEPAAPKSALVDPALPKPAAIEPAAIEPAAIDPAQGYSLSGVVIVLEGVPNSQPAPTHALIYQQNRRFVPELTVVTKGSTVEFANRDTRVHEVFSVSRAARFDLGPANPGASRRLRLDRVGVIDVYCRFHEAAAKIKVVDTRFHAVTGADGQFRIADVPPGTYAFTAWHAAGHRYRGQVTVVPGKVVSVPVHLAQPGHKKPQRRSGAGAYKRYR